MNTTSDNPIIPPELLFNSIVGDAKLDPAVFGLVETLSTFPWPDIFGGNARLQREYLRFLFLKQILQDFDLPPTIAPSAIVDEVWHEHLLRPKNYFLLGRSVSRVIDHDPKTQFSADRDSRYYYTKVLYKNFFHEDPPPEFWPDEARLVARRPSLDSDITFHPTAQRIVVNVKGPIGDQYILSLNCDETIYSMKSRIEEQMGARPRDQIIVWGGMELLDTITLAHYNIQSNTTVHLLVQPPEPKPAGDDIMITVRTRFNIEFKVNINTQETIEDLKIRIREIQGPSFPWNQQRLTFSDSGASLDEDRKKIGDYGIEAGCTLLVVTRMAGC